MKHVVKPQSGTSLFYTDTEIREKVLLNKKLDYGLVRPFLRPRVSPHTQMPPLPMPSTLKRIALHTRLNEESLAVLLSHTQVKIDEFYRSAVPE